MAVEPEIEKHEDGLDKDGEAGEVSSISQPPGAPKALNPLRFSKGNFHLELFVIWENSSLVFSD